MFKIFTFAGFVLLTACASVSPQTKQLVNNSQIISSSHIKGVPFIAQADGDCGPSSLAMLMNWVGTSTTTDELRPQVYTPKRNGSLPTEILATPRKYGLMATQIDGLENLTREITEEHPVLVMLNMGFSWAPRWHYAVVTGYDLTEQLIYLHSGESANVNMPISHFERYWSMADYWAMTVLPPDRLAKTPDELEHMKAASGIEAAGHLEAAKVAYSKILEQWPESEMALLGLGNINYQQGLYPEAVRYFKNVLKINSNSTAAKTNLKIAQQHIN